MEQIYSSIRKNIRLLKTQEGEDEVHSAISKLFQMIFSQYSKDYNQLQITSSHLQPNYIMYPSTTSIIKRYLLLGKRGDEDIKKHIIVKLPNKNPKLNKFGVGILHENEIMAYQKILPVLDQEIFRIPTPAPEVYFASKDCIIMEDLRESKHYIPENRHKVMSSYQCRLITRTLAMFHARSLVCKIKSPNEFDTLKNAAKEVLFFYKQSPILDYMHRFFDKLIDVFEKKPYISLEKECTIKSLRRLRENFEGQLKHLIFYEDEHSVICHGDLRASNIFLDGKVGVKFIDFQQICYSSVARDLVTLFYVNAEPYDMVRFMKSFQHTYLEFLHLFLKEHDVDLTKELTSEWLMDQMEKFKVYGIVYGLWHSVEFYFENTVEPLSIDELCELKCGNMNFEGEFLQRVIELLAYYENQNEKEKKADDQEVEKIISENKEKSHGGKETKVSFDFGEKETMELLKEEVKI